MRHRTWLRGLLGGIAAWAALVASADAGLLDLTFHSAVAGTIADTNGLGTGLTTRLAGTGGSLAADDANLQLDTTAGLLHITSTNSDLSGQRGLGVGEYLGTQLSSLGFTGSQDFSVSATFQDIDYTTAFDQFGLYVGTSSSSNFRAITLFGAPTNDRYLYGVSNQGGSDVNPTNSSALAPREGDSFTLTLSRTGGIYQVSIADLTNPARSGVLAINQPSFLNGASDLSVGILAANSENGTSKLLNVSEYSVNVGNLSSVPEPSSLISSGIAGLIGLGYARRRWRRGSPRSGLGQP